MLVSIYPWIFCNILSANHKMHNLTFNISNKFRSFTFGWGMFISKYICNDHLISSKRGKFKLKNFCRNKNTLFFYIFKCAFAELKLALKEILVILLIITLQFKRWIKNNYVYVYPCWLKLDINQNWNRKSSLSYWYICQPR